LTASARTAPLPDGKAADALRTIGEVADLLGIRQHVLRYWEDQFPILRPLKRAGGRRYYRPDDVALLMRIDRLVHQQGYTLRGARLALAGNGGEGAEPAAGSSTPGPFPAEDAGAAHAGGQVAGDRLPMAPVQAPAPNETLSGRPADDPAVLSVDAVGQLRALRDRLAAALG
jgi:DNA-binding transcriptional MerR regulator